MLNAVTLTLTFSIKIRQKKFSAYTRTYYLLRPPSILVLTQNLLNVVILRSVFLWFLVLDVVVLPKNTMIFAIFGASAMQIEYH